MNRRNLAVVVLVGVLGGSAAIVGRAQVVTGQAVDENGAPQFRVDPFWPKPLPNRWSMQQVTGISVDSMDHVWFLNRANAPELDEIGGDGNPAPVLCCVRGPELIELDQQGNVLSSWGGRRTSQVADQLADGDCRLEGQSSGSAAPTPRTASSSIRATARCCGTSIIVRPPRPG